jgi:hypothetical protein
MKNIKLNCKYCNIPFLADKREINRGNAKYCSLSCSTKNTLEEKYSNPQLIKTFICKHCSRSFKSNTNTFAKYCSTICRQKNYRAKKKSDNNFDN